MGKFASNPDNRSSEPTPPPHAVEDEAMTASHLGSWKIKEVRVVNIAHENLKMIRKDVFVLFLFCFTSIYGLFLFSPLPWIPRLDRSINGALDMPMHA